MFMRRLLIEPAPFLDHLEGGECLLGLIVIVELPRQIGDEKQKDNDSSNEPNGAFVFEQALCHVGWLWAVGCGLCCPQRIPLLTRQTDLRCGQRTLQSTRMKQNICND